MWHEHEHVSNGPDSNALVECKMIILFTEVSFRHTTWLFGLFMRSFFSQANRSDSNQVCAKCSTRVISDYPRWFRQISMCTDPGTRHTVIRSIEANIGVLLDALRRNETKNRIVLHEHIVHIAATRDNSSGTLCYLLKIHCYL